MSYTIDPSDNVLKILTEDHYYPFGLKHHGYSNFSTDVRVPPGLATLMVMDVNDLAYKYKYNGIEFQDELGLDMYAMDMRQYDPAIARWVVQDPVVHHNFSPYSAFDNNPVYWADPSGADAEESKDLFGRNKYDSMGMYIPPYERTGGSVIADGGGVGGNDRPFGQPDFEQKISKRKDTSKKEETSKGESTTNTKYTPTKAEFMIYTFLMPQILKVKYSLIAKFTGQDRHRYGPDAISLAKTVEGGAVVGGVVSAGAIRLLRGLDSKPYTMTDWGAGFSTVSIATGFTGQQYFYDGDLNDISIRYFEGYRFSASGSIDAGVSGGIDGSYSKTHNNKGSVYAISIFVGLGGGPGLDGNINFGETTIIK